MYVKPFNKILGQVGFQLTPKIIGIGTSERNWNGYKHVQFSQSSRLQIDSSEKQAILYGAAKMHNNSITGTICVYNWTNVIFDMGLDKILRHYRDPCHARIFND